MIAALVSGCQTMDPPQFLHAKPASYIEIKYSATVPQHFDFSCGGATIATILTYYWGRPTTEVEVLDKLRSRYPGQEWSKLKDNGFSLDDLIWASNKLGFEAQAAAIAADELEKVSGPIIVHLDVGKFQHFSVMRLRKGGRTYLSDPVEGAKSLSNEEFDRQYTGSALAIWKKSASLPKNPILARPFPAIDPSLVIGGAGRGRETYTRAPE